MILITDSGSSKCDWVLLDSNGKIVLKTTTSGLNPALISEEELFIIINTSEALIPYFEKATVVDFFGAGCSSKTPVKVLSQVLKKIFIHAEISVKEDTVAAVRSVTQLPGIVCILGTGSNSCYFDGSQIHYGTVSLGYTLMDEASGNYFGKQLLRDYFYKKMPKKLVLEFEEKFNLEPDEIKTNLYKNPNPNMYLASFAEFIFIFIGNRSENSEEINDYFENLLREGIHLFITNRILCFKEAKQVPIHFVGSIAHFSKDLIVKCLKEYQLEMGSVVQKPIDGLVEFYKRNKI